MIKDKLLYRALYTALKTKDDERVNIYFNKRFKTYTDVPSDVLVVSFVKPKIVSQKNIKIILQTHLKNVFL